MDCVSGKSYFPVSDASAGSSLRPAKLAAKSNDQEMRFSGSAERFLRFITRQGQGRQCRHMLARYWRVTRSRFMRADMALLAS